MGRFFRWLKRIFTRKPRKKPVRRAGSVVTSHSHTDGGKRLKYEIHFIKGFTEKQKNFYISMLHKTLYVINTVEFRSECYGRYMSKTENLNRTEIYKLFMSGADKFNKKPDYDIDIMVTAYYKNNRVIGYTRRDTIKTWINKKFFRMNDRGMATLGGNLIHEQMHNLGFGHPARGFTRKETPYVYGYITSDLIRRYLRGEKFTPLTLSHQEHA